GRNQEIALSSALSISGLRGVIIASASTDGVDGPTDAAGAIVDGATIYRSKKMGLDAEKYLRNNDSYSFFKALGDLIYTGPTGTNVNDLTLLIVL
ncbi:MAG: MOFRL family protein, partial [Candidatus Bathyarchaeia archaeon]